MRLASIRLENFIGPWNGMGLTDLYIDFMRCTHKILVIKSDNGCGKSSFLRTVTPLSDNTKDLVPGKPARKTISYLLNDMSRLTITYTYPINKNGDRMTSKCSVVRTFADGKPIELNSSGNIGTGKDIIYELFGIDDSFPLLSYISATQKGLGALIPSQRKQFIKSALSTIDFYIALYKTLSKKHTILKSLLNSVTTKLSQIGNVELIKSTLLKQNEELKSLESKKNTLLDSTHSMKAEMEVLSNGKDITQELNTAISKHAELEKEYRSLNQENIVYSEERISELEKTISSDEAKLEVSEERIKEYVNDESSIRTDIQQHRIELDSIGNVEIIEETKKKISSIEEKIKACEFAFESIGFKEYENISQADYDSAVNAIKTINTSITNLGANYGEEEIKSVLSSNPLDSGDFSSTLTKLTSNLDMVKSKIQEQYNLIESNKDYDKIPSDCNHKDSCPFIATLVQNQKKILSKHMLEELESRRDNIIQSISDINKKIESIGREKQCYSEIKYILQYTSSMANLISKFIQEELTEQNIRFHIERSIPLKADLDKYIEYSNYITIISNLKKDKTVLTEQVKELESHYEKSMSLKKEMDFLNKNLEKITDKKLKLLEQINLYKNNLIYNRQELAKLNNLKASKERYEQLVKELSENDKSLAELTAKSNRYNEISVRYAKEQAELNTLTLTNIPQLNNSIEQSKYRLVMYDQYKADLNKYQDLYNKEEMLRRYSGSNGIQTVYMSVFMNSILQNTNNLLKMLFGGRFRLQQFVINETEFSIPCIDDEGNLRNDISLMSDSQLSMISMILSFVIFHEASKNYNIIKLDEVDDNLDNSNRLQFSALINKLMSTLQYDQCLIVSHNDEIDLTNSDMILFKVENQGYLNTLKNSGANIIYSYQ